MIFKIVKNFKIYQKFNQVIKFPFIILVYAINKGLSTEERIKHICDFKSKRLKTIIATDALNRGINLNVDIII